jgi:hypothetical protein
MLEARLSGPLHVHQLNPAYVRGPLAQLRNMGIIISLIVLPIQSIHDRRKKKKAEKIARNYTDSNVAPPTQYQSQSQPRQQELVSTPQQSQLAAAPHPELATPSQQQQRAEEFNPTLGAARIGYPAPA